MDETACHQRLREANNLLQSGLAIIGSALQPTFPGIEIASDYEDLVLKWLDQVEQYAKKVNND
jgi:hypothetical protein